MEIIKQSYWMQCGFNDNRLHRSMFKTVREGSLYDQIRSVPQLKIIIPFIQVKPYEEVTMARHFFQIFYKGTFNNLTELIIG